MTLTCLKLGGMFYLEESKFIHYVLKRVKLSLNLPLGEFLLRLLLIPKLPPLVY